MVPPQDEHLRNSRGPLPRVPDEGKLGRLEASFEPNESKTMNEFFQVFPVGIVRKSGDTVRIEIVEKYHDALLGLEQFSHILVFCWYHKNDRPERRNTLQVHPRGDRKNPLTGVFATRSPVRPNLIAMTICRLISIEGNVIRVDEIDAFDGTPVIDIKPCISRLDFISGLKVPTWVKNEK